MKTFFRSVCVAAVLMLATTASANVLDFAGTFGSDSLHPEGIVTGPYRDHHGDTPNIGVGFSTRTNLGAVATFALVRRHAGFGDLADAASPFHDRHFGGITLTPDAGWEVNLHSFDLAARSNPVTGQSVRVFGAGRDLLWAPPSFFTVTPTGHQHFTPNLTSDGPLTIQFGQSWDIAIDNIVFSQTRIPPPTQSVPDGVSSTLLLGLALVVLTAMGSRFSGRFAS